MSTGSGTKQAAHRLKILFGLAGFKAAELHGNLTQVQRLDVSNSHVECYPYIVCDKIVLELIAFSMS